MCTRVVLGGFRPLIPLLARWTAEQFRHIIIGDTGGSGGADEAKLRLLQARFGLVLCRTGSFGWLGQDRVCWFDVCTYTLGNLSGISFSRGPHARARVCV